MGGVRSGGPKTSLRDDTDHLARYFDLFGDFGAHFSLYVKVHNRFRRILRVRSYTQGVALTKPMKQSPLKLRLLNQSFKLLDSHTSSPYNPTGLSRQGQV